MSDPSGSNFGVDPKILEKDGIQFAHLAVQNDTNGQHQLALFYYNEAGQALLAAALAGSLLSGITDKATEYLLRAEEIKNSRKALAAPNAQLKTAQQLDVERAHFLLHQAFEEDENGQTEEAVELYTEAVELCIKIRSETKDLSLQERCKKLATQALDRAESLKEKPKTPTPSPTHTPTSGPASTGGQIRTLSGHVVPPMGFGAFRDEGDDTQNNAHAGHGAPAGQVSAPQRKGVVNVGPGGYTKDEINVLRNTSSINGRSYVPFMSVDMKERFAYPVTFTDKEGKLALSPKQQSRFSRWVRPDEFMDGPQMIIAVSCFSIRQTLVSDCSFVASLAISAQYERRFKKKLITSVIYPQNRKGEPVYNPCGKYMVKLNINGVPRKVIIDDYLPMGRDGELLCSYSNNSNELWVSLLEKAYLKVMGGYDFPGSNSNIDLHSLTGWIPERVAIRPGHAEFDQNKEFSRLLDRFHKGHCLVTIATGEMSEANADKAGLVPTHAYAMLDIREVKGKKLLMLKNPWNHLRWKGNYCERDMQHWTPDLQKALNYDPKSAQTFDNGVFWIDYESLCHFYDVIYINWNPDLFSHTTCIHDTWLAKEGPTRDSYNMSDNPQYRLELRSSKPTAMWIHLTRHITDKDDFADNKEFITLLVYKTGGKKIFYPYDPPPYKDGIRINSPHYLVKLLEDPTSGSTHYTLVISQYEKNNTINYTLRVYTTAEFSLTKITDPYLPKLYKRITGQWSGRTAGGCGNFPTHKNNPIYQINMENNNSNNHIMIELLGPKSFSVGFEVITVGANVGNAPGAFTKTSSGSFRPGYCVLQLDNISGGVYNIQPSTFSPGNEGHFFLDISSSAPYTLAQLQ